MASQNIYAPIVNSYEPAFNYKTNDINGKCKVYFALSDYNTRADVDYVHASVINASTNQNVINTTSEQVKDSVLTAAGIILNLQIEEDENRQGLYFVEISGDYINDNQPGWNIGSIYKIQLRLTKEKCNFTEAVQQVTWLNENANKFSEWSTTITTKAIGDDNIDIPIFNQEVLTSPSLDIIGTYSTTDNSEKLYSINIKLYQDSELLEDSGIIYKDSFDGTDKFAYNLKTELRTGIYKFAVSALTINKHEYNKIYEVTVSINDSEVLEHLFLTTMPNMLGYEEDEGCVILKLDADVIDFRYKGILRICRASDEDGFVRWEYLKELTYEEETPVAEMPLFKDFTIESGRYYKYGLQEIIKESETKITKSKIKETNEIQIIFEYNYLLGEDSRQLKLKYNTTLSNFHKTYSDVITPTIGSKYPFITRIGKADYYSFTINGKISFSMDDNNLFVEKDFIYGYNKDSLINQYDYTYERRFRDEVYKYLTNAKPKVFKSPTEGNIIVRLSNVSLSPETSLSRLIYNFSATATEIDESNIKNYIKYNIISEVK